MKHLAKSLMAMLIAMTTVFVLASCEKDSISNRIQQDQISVEKCFIRTIIIPEGTYITDESGDVWKVSGNVTVEVTLSYPYVTIKGGHIILENQRTGEILEFDYSVHFNENDEEDGLDILDGDFIDMGLLNTVHNYLNSNISNWIE